MATFSLEDAQPFLMPLRDEAVQTLLESQAELRELLDLRPEMHDVLDSSTQASMLSNIFAHRVRPRFANVGVNWQQSGRMQHGAVGGSISLRFKKLTTDLHSMNVPTESQARLYHQWQLPGVPEMTQVTLGYVLDPITRAIGAAFFICPSGFSTNHWSWAIYGGGDGPVGLYSNDPIEPDAQDDGLDVGISIVAADAEIA